MKPMILFCMRTFPEDAEVFLESALACICVLCNGNPVACDHLAAAGACEVISAAKNYLHVTLNSTDGSLVYIVREGYRAIALFSETASYPATIDHRPSSSRCGAMQWMLR